MKYLAISLGVVCMVMAGCIPNEKDKEGNTNLEHSYVAAEDGIAAGRYLVIVGGCNDCHTNNYLMTEGNVPEEDWLTGSPVGWQGPWGTTYPSNLRLRTQEWTEDQWVATLKTRTGLPPMPWMNVNQMSEQDMRAIYTYIKSLGPKGEHMPLAIKPDVKPETPYLSMFPQNMPGTMQH